MQVVDLRSDTVTQPTAAMRDAMARAEVGDDVYGEDPTVRRLEELAAERTGHQAGLLVPSGTMANLVAVLAHCGRGDEAILGGSAHSFLYEAGGISALGGVHSHQLPNQPDGTLELQAVTAAIRPDDPHFPRTRLVAIENTQNRMGGVPLTAGYTRAVAELAHQHGLRLHLDGARLFNAAVVLGVPARALAAPADSVSFCLSKGLCAPVGSVLCGTSAFIGGARRLRKQLGGGMRQAGVLAAAGIVALESMVERLAEDHARAAALARGLAALPGLRLVAGSPHTNMVFVNLEAGAAATEGAGGKGRTAAAATEGAGGKGRTAAAPEAVRRLAEHGVLASPTGPRQLRLVTHHGIDDAAIARAIDAFRRVIEGAAAAAPAPPAPRAPR